MLLEAWDHSVHVAYDSDHALELLPASVVPISSSSDVGFRAWTATRLAARMQAEEHRAHLVALTGYTDRGRAIEAGFEEHFTKPIDPDALRALLARV